MNTAPLPSPDMSPVSDPAVDGMPGMAPCQAEIEKFYILQPLADVGGPHYDEYGFCIEDDHVRGGVGVRWSGRSETDRKGDHKEWDKFMEEHANTGNVARSKALKLLVREGVPGPFRGRLWPCLARTAELRKHHPLRHYEELLMRVEEGQGMQPDVSSAIDKDLRRTFPG